MSSVSPGLEATPCHTHPESSASKGVGLIDIGRRAEQALYDPWTEDVLSRAGPGHVFVFDGCRLEDIELRLSPLVLCRFGGFCKYCRKPLVAGQVLSSSSLRLDALDKLLTSTSTAANEQHHFSITSTQVAPNRCCACPGQQSRLCLSYLQPEHLFGMILYTSNRSNRRCS